ncbi:MAG: TRAP transporter fused permease subunit [Spirochaetaceae bacterium]|nr:MAG: TRAP transporter fused permease subunit [Spirochaetaceae bacterium]
MRESQGPGRRKSIAEQDIIDLSKLESGGQSGPQTTHNLKGTWYLIFTVLAIISAVFHFYTGGYRTLPAMMQRPIHLAFILVFTYMLYPATKKGLQRNRPSLLDIVFALLAVVSALFLVFNIRAIALARGRVSTEEMIMGVIFMVLLVEAGRRAVGTFMLVFAAVFIAYLFVGPWLPGVILRHGGFSLARVVSHMYTSIEGVFGIAVGVSATYVYLFILFGAFLSKSGTTQVFADLALAAAGASVGGPAKVGIIASGLMGTVQGSSAANVAATGLFTIPLMKSLGFKAHFAAAVEAVASCGGQFLPPVMGASAFIMAQYLGRPYAYVAAGALLPALLYYAAVYLQVHLHARKMNMQGIDRSRLPAIGGVLLRKGHLLLPIVILVGMIVFGFTALYAAFMSTISIFIISSLRKQTRMSLGDILDGMRMAARSCITTALACAIVGFVVGAVALSGLAMLITQQIVRLGAGQLLPTLLLAAASSLVLSFGLPTTSVYIITATLVAPGLTAVGLPPLVSHLFCYYWGGVSAITPPVALAVYVGCGIAGAPLMKTGFTAMRLGIAAYVVPFYFAFWPMLITRDAPVLQIGLAVLGGVITVICLAGLGERYYFRSLPWFKFVLLLAAAPLLIAATTWSQLSGTALVAYVILSELFVYRATKRIPVSAP